MKKKEEGDLAKLVGPVEHEEGSTPSYIAVQRYLDGFRDPTFNL
jgi:hypothetical protein